MSTAVVLFCDNFRIVDNPPLYEACSKHSEIILLYIYNEHYLGRKLGEASKVFLHHVLKEFSNLLQQKYNAKLTILSGDEIENLEKIHKERSFDAIYLNNGYSQAQQMLKQNLIQFANKRNINLNGFDCGLLFQPGTILTGSGESFKIFTPFSKQCLKNQHLIQASQNCPEGINYLELKTLSVDELNLLPAKNWHRTLMKHYEINYDKILQNFDSFILNNLSSYQDNRNNLESDSNSKISPFLRFGVLSVRYCFNAAIINTSQLQFVMELLWREFAYHTFAANCDIYNCEIRSEYKNFKWDDNEEYLHAWQKGNTGYDIVDAAMIELYATGLMHGRARMITASFLIKDLFCNWRKGEEWFWDTLIDADPAINPFSWQWVFGSGLDGAPYFRIFNPDSQAQRFDLNGTYRKKWLGNKYGALSHAFVSHDLQRKEAMKRYKQALHR